MVMWLTPNNCAIEVQSTVSASHKLSFAHHLVALRRGKARAKGQQAQSKRYNHSPTFVHPERVGVEGGTTMMMERRNQQHHRIERTKVTDFRELSTCLVVQGCGD
jgi:hypothetical protein